MSEVMRNAVIRMPFEMAMECEVSRRQFYSRAQSLLDELERAECVINQESQAASAYKMQAIQALNELEQCRKDAASLRGSCKVLGEQNKHLTRRAKALSRAVSWYSDIGIGVARPKWLLAILAKEGGANG